MQKQANILEELLVKKTASIEKIKKVLVEAAKVYKEAMTVKNVLDNLFKVQ